MSEPVPWVGLAALVAMVTEPWWQGLLDREPRRRERPPEPRVDRPVRGVLVRPVGRELEGRGRDGSS